MEKVPHTRGRHLNNVAWVYDPLIERLSFGRERRFREKTIEYMDISPKDSILDIGCGTGSLTLLAAGYLKDPGKITGIDAAPKMIKIARRKAEHNSINVNFQVGVSEALDFPDCSFDIVVNSMFTHHIDRELKNISFKEMYRVLKPGARLITADIDRPSNIFSALIGWASRFILFQRELDDNLRGLLPVFMGEAGFIDIRRLEQLYGMVSFFVCRRPGETA